MEFSEIQLSITALFLLMAVAIVVLCNRLRKKSRRGPKVTLGKYVSQRRPVKYEFEPLFQTASPISFWPELAVLSDAGMREESSAWRKPDQSSNLALTSVRTLGEPEPSPGPSNALQLPPLTIDEFLFDILVSGGSAQEIKDKVSVRTQRNLLPSIETHFEAVQEAQSSVSAAGMINRPALARLLEGNKSFSGVVVSICINENESSWCSESLLEWVENYIAGLLEEHDFGCRTAPKEFLLVCPTMIGAKAQRRLKEISERLWEFQLRGIGTHSVVFNWGGVEVQNRPLAHALSAATERMSLTRRGRSPIYMNSVNTRR
jgi:hypothetical protein